MRSVQRVANLQCHCLLIRFQLIYISTLPFIIRVANTFSAFTQSDLILLIELVLRLIEHPVVKTC
jgi:hypothetical protein